MAHSVASGSLFEKVLERIPQSRESKEEQRELHGDSGCEDQVECAGMRDEPRKDLIFIFSVSYFVCLWGSREVIFPCPWEQTMREA